LDTGEEYLSEEKGANYVIPGVNTCQTVPVMYNRDSIEIGVFAPGDTLYGTTAMSPPSSTGEYDEGTYYFKLVDSYAEIVAGQNTGVSVSVNPISSHASCSVVKHVTIDNSTIWGDPVDTASGAYVEDYEALAVNGETTLSLDLNYSSMLTDTVGEMGKGWSHNFQTYLEETTGTINLHWTPDSVSTFVRKDAVTHSVMYGNYLSDESIALSEDIPNEQEYLCISAGLDGAVLQRNKDLTYTLILPSGVAYDFTPHALVIPRERLEQWFRACEFLAGGHSCAPIGGDHAKGTLTQCQAPHGGGEEQAGDGFHAGTASFVTAISAACRRSACRRRRPSGCGRGTGRPGHTNRRRTERTSECDQLVNLAQRGGRVEGQGGRCGGSGGRDGPEIGPAMVKAPVAVAGTTALTPMRGRQS